MMSAMTEVVISAMDLAKAEMRQGRAGLVRLIVALALALAAVMLGVVGLILVLTAIMLGLMQTMTPAGAAAITAAASLFFAAVLTWLVRDLLKP